MKILELTLDDIIELGRKPDPQKLVKTAQIREGKREKRASSRSTALRAIDDVFWELIQEGKTEEEVFKALGIDMPKGNGIKPWTEKATNIAKLLKRQAKEKPLPSLEDDDEWYEVDEAYREELAARVEAGVKGE